MPFRSRSRELACLASLVLLQLAGCSPGGARPEPVPAPGEPDAVAASGVVKIPALADPSPWTPPRPEEAEPGLIFRLDEAPAGAMPGAAAAPASAPLDGTRAAALLARLPALPPEAGDTVRLPVASPPPPRAGADVRASFPPADTTPPPARPDRPAAAPLEVLRVSPTGETADLAPHLTVVFSQPMIPLTTVGETDRAAVPARLTPQPPGRWRWIDVRTLRFEPEGRLPMATEFTLEVPAGTRSLDDGALAEAVRERFATPAVRAVGGWPHERPVGREPLVVLVFDQQVRPEEVLRAAALEAEGRAHALRLATPGEIAADSTVAALVERAPEGRWAVLRPLRPLPADVPVRLVLRPGLASAEGPRRQTLRQELDFSVHGPLRVVESRCAWHEEQECPPGAPWMVRFSNPLDAQAWDPDFVRVDPAVDDIQADVAGEVLMLRVQAQPRTGYRVRLDARIRDVFGQTLGAPAEATFRVGDREPMLTLPGAPLILLDPAGPPRLPLFTRRHEALRVRINRVTPDDWAAFGAAVQAFYRGGRGAEGVLALPGRPVVDTVIRPDASPGALALSELDLAPALPGGLGHAVVAVEPVRQIDAGRRGPQLGVAWVQSTRIGLSAMVEDTLVRAWAVDVAGGTPLGGVALRLLPGGPRATTSADGTAALPIPAAGADALVASRGDDVALLPGGDPRWTGDRRAWQRQAQARQLAWYVFSDRGLYRPGETVHLKGWVRRLGSAEGPALPAGLQRVVYDARGPQREELGGGRLTPSALGGFHAAFELPEALNLGQAGIELRAEGRGLPEHGTQAYHGVQVQEFRRPDYEVSVDGEAGPHLVGQAARFTLRAAYYGGGALPGAAVSWRVSAGPGQFTPPGRDGWHFGRAPWRYWGRPTAEPVRTLEGATDAAGEHAVRVDLLSAEPPFPYLLRAEAEARDVTRQAGSGAAERLVHPAALAVGLRMPRAWPRAGEPIRVESIVVDLEGRGVAGRRVELRLERTRHGVWPMPRPAAGGAAGAPQDSVLARCSVVSGEEPATCELAPPAPGSFRVVAEVVDDRGRTSRSELLVWTGGAPLPEPGRVEAEPVTVVPDREEYAAGETAELLVRAPFAPAEGLLTVRRGRIVHSERFRMDTQERVLRVAVTEALYPAAEVQLELRDASGRAGIARGSARLVVPPRRRELSVEVAPRDSVVAPGAGTRVEVRVRHADGWPAAGAEVALWVVDEAVLALGGYSLPDPLQVFYPEHGTNVRDLTLLTRLLRAPRPAAPGTVSGVLIDAVQGGPLAGARVMLEGTDIAADADAAGAFVLRGVPPGAQVLEVRRGEVRVLRRAVEVPPQGLALGLLLVDPTQGDGVTLARRVRDGAVQADAVVLQSAEVGLPPPPPAAPPIPTAGARGGAEEPVQVRTDLAPLAHFEPALRTDADGRTAVQVTLPGSLTRYRVFAVAVEGDFRFGRGEATLTARRELTVRPTLPRFLNFGDTTSLPVLVQNLGGTPLEVEVALRAQGLRVEGPAAQRVRVAAGDRAEVRFRAVAERAGTAHVQVIAAAGALSDAAQLQLPVYTPATAEAFATYGEVDDDRAVVLPVTLPGGVLPQVGGLEVTLSATALATLTDAVAYLHAYPFDGAEHIASRILGTAAVRDVLQAFAAAELPPPAELDAAVQRDIDRLAALQGGDGGWAFWRWDGRSHPYVSVHAAHALQRAREAGYRVPEEAAERARRYLAGMERHLPAEYPARARRALTAYALYTRVRMGDAAALPEARRLAREPVPGSLPLEGAGWLLHALAGDAAAAQERAELLRQIRNRATETAQAVSFAARYEEGEQLMLHSERRSDAVILEALLAADPASDLIPKTVRGLLGHRVQGRWRTTQENVWVLLALDRYFRVFERVTPDFRAGVWLGERQAGSHVFRGRTAERFHVEVPMREVLRTPRTELTLQRRGEGRMYYRAGLRYAPATLRLAAESRGFTVDRVYEAVDSASDVQRLADGSWSIRAGARVRVRLTMVAPERRHHVALIDPLPAGLEPLNPALQGTGIIEEPVPGPVPPPRPLPRPALAPDAAVASPRIAPPRGPYWAEHRNLRDDRAEAFAALLPAGVYEYSYLARATVPGAFVAPPPRAEEMYAPETFGRGATDRVVVR